MAKEFSISVSTLECYIRTQEQSAGVLDKDKIHQYLFNWPRTLLVLFYALRTKWHLTTGDWQQQDSVPIQQVPRALSEWCKVSVVMYQQGRRVSHCYVGLAICSLSTSLLRRRSSCALPCSHSAPSIPC